MMEIVMVDTSETEQKFPPSHLGSGQILSLVYQSLRLRHFERRGERE